MKRTVLFLIISLAALGLWANGAAETQEEVSFSQTELTYEPVRVITVTPSADILAVFESNGIDSSCLLNEVVEDDDDNEFLLPPPVNQEVREQLTAIISENRDSVVDLINAELKSKLHRGGTEKAVMTIGSYQFAASLDYPQA